MSSIFLTKKLHFLNGENIQNKNGIDTANKSCRVRHFLKKRRTCRLLHGYFLVSFLNYRFYEFNYGKGIILKMAYQCKSESFQSPVIHNLDNYTKNWKMSSVF